MAEKVTSYRYRELARVVLEALTPIKVGTGLSTHRTTSSVVRDINGLPYLPGTSLCGVIRHALPDNELFGDQSCGSRLFITDGVLVGPSGKPVDGLVDDPEKDPFLAKYYQLPVRNHVRINGKGTNADTGLFNEQVVFAGTRFVFEIETESSDKANELMDVLKALKGVGFSIGGGKNDGFGKVKVVESYYRSLDLGEADDLNLYLSKSSNLSDNWTGWAGNATPIGDPEGRAYEKFTLDLRPFGTYLFGSGSSDTDADMTPVKEAYVQWNDGKPSFSEKKVIIPGTSIKGALSHRTAYHYNKMTAVYSDSMTPAQLSKAESMNDAVIALFGTDNNREGKPVVGRVIISDVFMKEQKTTDKIMNHVVINSFTGGAQNGKLFTEKASFSTDTFCVEVLVKTEGLKEEYLDALKKALQDICDGLLPLGGGVNRGNGIFTGTLTEE